MQKLHRGVGHPRLRDFIRFMRAARVKPEIVQWASKHFRCEACEAKPKPKPRRPAAIPKTYQPNRVVGVNFLFLPDVGDAKMFPALSILDWGSHYQMVEIFPTKDHEEVWKALWRCWVRTF